MLLVLFGTSIRATGNFKYFRDIFFVLATSIKKKVNLFIYKFDYLSCSPFQAGRYHSLVIEKDSFPHDALEIVAWTDDGLIMAARHRKYKHIQVYFHVSFFYDTMQIITSNRM